MRKNIKLLICKTKGRYHLCYEEWQYLLKLLKDDNERRKKYNSKLKAEEGIQMYHYCRQLSVNQFISNIISEYLGKEGYYEWANQR